MSSVFEPQPRKFTIFPQHPLTSYKNLSFRAPAIKVCERGGGGVLSGGNWKLTSSNKVWRVSCAVSAQKRISRLVLLSFPHANVAKNEISLATLGSQLRGWCSHSRTSHKSNLVWRHAHKQFASFFTFAHETSRVMCLFAPSESENVDCAAIN